MKKLLILSAAILPLLILFNNGNAQPNPDWVATYNGPASKSDNPRVMVIDGQNNIYVTGTSDGEKRGNMDYATVKYNAAGQQLWVARYNGTGNGTDYPYGLTVDAAGYVYVTGRSIGISGNYDYATIKYNSLGVQQWVARFNGPANMNDFGRDVKVDASGNVYVTGLANGNENDILRGNACITIKYNSNGEEQWKRTYDASTSGEVSNSLALDAYDNIYIVGESSGTVIIKYDATGQLIWIRNVTGGYGSGAKVLIDGSGAIIVSSGGETIKYDVDGNLIWHESFNASFGDIALDAFDNVYVTGFASDQGYSDYMTAKYNAGGGLAWSRRFNGSANSTDIGRSIALDNSGNIYVTGYCTMGSGRSTSTNFGTVKYNAAGTQQWLALYPGHAFGIVTDNSGNVYVTGEAAGSKMGTDYGTLRYPSSISASKSVTKAPAAETQQSNFSLQNHPNPFSQTTIIEYQIPREVKVKLTVYDLLGKEIATLVNETKPAGVHKVNFSANRLSAGTYVCRMQIGDFIQTRKLTLLR